MRAKTIRAGRASIITCDEEYAAQTVANAEALGESLKEHGFGLVSGGTDTHFVLVDLREPHEDVTGKDAEKALEAVGIVLNANTVPGETRSPFVTSGIRAGTPALKREAFSSKFRNPGR